MRFSSTKEVFTLQFCLRKFVNLCVCFFPTKICLLSSFFVFINKMQGIFDLFKDSEFSSLQTFHTFSYHYLSPTGKIICAILQLYSSMNGSYQRSQQQNSIKFFMQGMRKERERWQRWKIKSEETAKVAEFSLRNFKFHFKMFSAVRKHRNVALINSLIS